MKEEDNQYIQIEVTTSSEELARELARLLVVKNLAACVQVSGPISSFYKWKGKLEEDIEWRCTIKTVKDNYANIEATIKEIHSYEVPEIICSAISGGSEDYLSWLSAQTKTNRE